MTIFLKELVFEMLPKTYAHFYFQVLGSQRSMKFYQVGKQIVVFPFLRTTYYLSKYNRLCSWNSCKGAFVRFVQNFVSLSKVVSHSFWSLLLGNRQKILFTSVILLAACFIRDDRPKKAKQLNITLRYNPPSVSRTQPTMYDIMWLRKRIFVSIDKFCNLAKLNFEKIFFRSPYKPILRNNYNQLYASKVLKIKYLIYNEKMS